LASFVTRPIEPFPSGLLRVAGVKIAVVFGITRMIFEGSILDKTPLYALRRSDKAMGLGAETGNLFFLIRQLCQ
jgi:hypothetical protein